MSSYTVTCRNCGTANRVPAAMEGKTGRCGRCRAALAPLYTRPRPLAEDTFDNFVDRYPGPVLVEFWAPS